MPLTFGSQTGILRPNPVREQSSATQNDMADTKTILFLEDEEELLTALGSLLRDQGYLVEQAQTGEIALKKLETVVPDLIIADIKLPGIDGFDFFAEVRKKPGLSQVPFVFLTAYNNLTAMSVAKRHGAAEYITKPFEFEYLVARIRQLLPL
jgi:DNA-binding response OmpR family regulator